jgi:CRP-like cAMP-binding protein
MSVFLKRLINELLILIGINMSNICTPYCNQLLGALTSEEFNRLSANLEPIQMPLGKVLYEPGDHIKYAYFPATAIVSLLYVLQSGASAEIAVIGFEGIVGIALFMGGETATGRAVVQSEG